MTCAMRVSAAVVLVAAAAVLHLAVGTQVDPGAALGALLGRDTDATTATIVFDVRLPRLLIAMAAGACLGVSGLLLQVVLRNPLAAPEITGVGSGAVLGAVIALSVGGIDATAPASTVLAATLGGLAAAALLWAAAGRAQPDALAVVGVVVSAALAGVTALLITANPAGLGGALRWLLGSVNGRTWPHWQLLWPWALAWLAVTALLAAVLTVLLTGDEQAAALGLPPRVARPVALGVAVALAAGAIAVVGAVAFVGLLVPHLARAVAGADQRHAVPIAVLAGAGALALADTVAQGVGRVGGGEVSLPVGAVTALLGAGVLIAFAGRGGGIAAPVRRRARVGVDVGDGAALRAEGVTVRFGERTVLDGVDLRIAAGELVVLAGTNGCGKSTLLRALSGAGAPDGGRVLLHGRPVLSRRPRDVARRLAVLHQHAPAVPGLTVRQLVRQGRYPHRGPLGMLRDADDVQCAAAMADAGVAELAGRDVDTLSGGERQRVRLALALAQGSPVLLLDEPTTHLDVRHQLEMLDLVVRLHAERGLTVVMVLHDLTQAARYAHRIVVLHEGGVVADGGAEVLTPDLLRRAFGVEARVVPDVHPLLAFDGPAR